MSDSSDMAVEPAFDPSARDKTGSSAHEGDAALHTDDAVQEDLPVTRRIVKLSEETINRIAAGEVRDDTVHT